jgi:hypothetical protein
MSIIQKQQEASIGVFYVIILHSAAQYQRPDVLIYGLTLTFRGNDSWFFKIACNIVIDKNHIPCLEILRRDCRWDAMSAFQYAISCKNQLIFTWLHKTCPLERYDDLISKCPYISDWFKVID